VRESFAEYPNAERFLRSLRWVSLAGLCTFVTGVSVGAVTSGVPRAMWLGAAVPFGLFLFVVFWLARRRTIRKIAALRNSWGTPTARTDGHAAQ